MSLIYDALRKSEQQRRAGEVPSLATPPIWQPQRRKPTTWPWVAAAVLAVGGLGWWLAAGDDEATPQRAANRERKAEPDAAGRRTSAAAERRALRAADRAAGRPTAPPVDPTVYRAPGVPYNAPVVQATPGLANATNRPGQTAAPVGILRGERAPRHSGAARAAEVAPDLQRKFESGEVFANNASQLEPVQPTTEQAYVPPEAALPQPLPEPAVAQPEAALAAAPPAPPTAAPAAPPSGPSVATAPSSASTPPATTAPAAAVRPPSTASPVAGPAAPVASAVPPPSTTAAAPPAAPAAAASSPLASTDPALAGVPSIYELTLAARRSLPALKLNMHVYNDDPTRRFAIIDGARATEGQPLGNDLNVEAIRPDGIVLSYRGERFLLPRTGR